jgi:alkylresorcinol/alkylpyrone synthase
MSIATIGPVAVTVPEHVLTQSDVKEAVGTVVPLGRDRLAAVLSLFDGAGVERRHSVLPVGGLHRPRDLTETMDIYRTHAIRLGRQVAQECLERAELAADEIDLVISVSCTGVMLPSLDAFLANDLGFRSDVRRLPITELGDDVSPANLISTAIFGDGAAAALVTGRAIPGARMLDARSHLFPRSLDALGFDLKKDGFHVVLGRELPGLVRADIKRLVTELLARNGLTRNELSVFALHPGGKRILDGVEDQLGLRPHETAPSRDILRTFGHLSSATVFFVLNEIRSRYRPAAGTHGLLGAFGPGFSAELSVLQWT